MRLRRFWADIGGLDGRALWRAAVLSHTLREMCGLTGIVLDDPRQRVDPGRLARMTDTLAHRGPDDRTFYSAGSAALGFRRLSIIDPAGGAQPLVNETGDVVLVLNGEL